MPKNLKKRSQEEIKKLKPFLDEWVERIEKPDYIDSDPVLFMHAFNKKEDRLLAGFFAATMAWGRRDVVIRKVRDFLNRMDNRPTDFITNFSDRDAKRFDGFKHRTFKPVDMKWLTKILQTILLDYGSFEDFWEACYQKAGQQERPLMAIFHEDFFALQPDTPRRTFKHVSNAEKKSSCKRLYLYLRWAIRQNSAVDLGLMNFMSPSELMIPLDVHVARQARKLGLLGRTYNDWWAVQELTESLNLLDPKDPAKYDYALFGLGVAENGLPEKFVINSI
ncbi:TIGR02757 family protein [Fodinibius salsisoli]|uniref:TIGR02757 family protein n=1 Tax=Fodinibius salsisoli TaxID=2820877 RepID=A0ABT3PPB3_9BACT|nr:TIGR02757 family protein [Fodinibius salsisoli]MCW9707697.1 TIGR02757 family protein [Fodinibius salsisoli]